MPPKRNYKFEKRQKDLAKQKKKEEKLRRKQERKEAGADIADDESGTQSDLPDEAENAGVEPSGGIPGAE